MGRDADWTRGRRAFGLTVTAFLWSVGLVVAALVVPVYGGTQTSSGPAAVSATTSTSSTLVGENGFGILLVVAVPALLTALVWIALHDKCSRGHAGSGFVAWGLIGLLAGFCLVAVLSIGVFVLPVALLLASAATLTPAGTRAGPPPTST